MGLPRLNFDITDLETSSVSCGFSEFSNHQIYIDGNLGAKDSPEAVVIVDANVNEERAGAIASYAGTVAEVLL